ncbi:MAG: hypothetical protein JO308_06030 [Verrucomicrobia bacterium]|nr:hypothetical protein [Verrucomicrobiota bacterium]
MHTSLDFELQRHLSSKRPGLAYRFGLACLMILWAVAMGASTALALALFMPDRPGLTEVIRALGNLLPSDAPLFTT